MPVPTGAPTNHIATLGASHSTANEDNAMGHSMRTEHAIPEWNIGQAADWIDDRCALDWAEIARLVDIWPDGSWAPTTVAKKWLDRERHDISPRSP